MKFASFTAQGRAAWGLVQGDMVADLSSVFPDLKSALAADGLAFAASKAEAAPKLALSAITYLPVLPNPDKIFCIGLNYADHVKETGRSDSEYPAVFARFANTQTGHLGPLVLPRNSTQFDYEGELAIVIGRGGRHISRADSWSHIAGYACYDEGSVRDFQRHTHQFHPGKNFPQTGAFGPCLVTPDEVGDLAKLRLQTRVNGTVLQDALIEQMIFDIPRQIEYCSSFTRLEPGDVIVTGTPGGVGSRRTPPIWLKEGDVVEIEIDRVGLLRNTVVAES